MHFIFGFPGDGVRVCVRFAFVENMAMIELRSRVIPI